MKLSIDESKLSAEDKKNPTIQLLLEINRQQAEFIRSIYHQGISIPCSSRVKKHSTRKKKTFYLSGVRFPPILMWMIPEPGIKAKTATAPISAMRFFPGLKVLNEKIESIF